jgi:hypothetical protein
MNFRDRWRRTGRLGGFDPNTLAVVEIVSTDENDRSVHVLTMNGRPMPAAVRERLAREGRTVVGPT